MLKRRAAPGARSDCCAIAVMAKGSEPGRTKTRLCPPLTPPEAAAFNTAFLRDIDANLAAAGAETELARFMAFGPPESLPFFEDLVAPEVGLIETWLPNFGACLAHAIETLLDLGYGGACVLNSDSPTLPTAALVAAARSLRGPGARIVFGPATDGGYYLLGMQQCHRRLFEDIDWSTPLVAAQTLQRAAELGLQTIMLPTWYDVDDAAALRTLAGETLRGRPFSAQYDSFAAPHAAALLRTQGLRAHSP
jgi:rSAM/selenodomain-associated transferase 1